MSNVGHTRAHKSSVAYNSSGIGIGIESASAFCYIDSESDIDSDPEDSIFGTAPKD